MTPKTKLPKKGRAEVKSKRLEIPMPVYNRMIEEAGLGWGEVTPFIIEAIKEKLDREKSREKAQA